jgi:DNA-binding NarL/FixJ family response regulator
VTVRVLLVDDERLVRAGFRMILAGEAGVAVVGEAADGFQAVTEVARLRPDVVLMDIRMPRLDGLEATRRILGRDRDSDRGLIDRGDGSLGAGAGPDRDGGSRRQPARIRPTRIIVLTTFDIDEYVYGALRAGASGFLLKDAPEEQLIAAIRLVADGGSIFAPQATRRLVEAFATPRTEPPPGLADLTPRELEVLRLLAGGRSNHEIADQLSISEHTAKTHVAHVLGKLELRDRVQAVVLAYESGVVRPGEEPVTAADAITGSEA